jgi:2-polyprenyl-6-methoxyphenol hydroxylase-like FAD-dependent oxidoreductase
MIDDVVIVGAGIGGLTLALELHARGIPCRLYEAAPEIKPMGFGINIQPCATELFARLGLLERLAALAVTTRECVFFNRHGQQIHRVDSGRFAGHAYPQMAIHRGDLQLTLLDATLERLGVDRVHTGWTCVGVDPGGAQARAHFRPTAGGSALLAVDARAVIAADGVHSAIYEALHPHGPRLRHSGIDTWRGVTLWPDFLSGASMVRIGLAEHGKLVAYPIRRNVNGTGLNLVNWVVELDVDKRSPNASSQGGGMTDFSRHFRDWRFDWLDVPSLISRAQGKVIALPMMDRDPLPHWGVGRVSLLGDAAHPMVPGGSNEASQAIVDAHCLADVLATTPDVERALRRYETQRRPATTRIVLGDRRGVVDTLVREVHRRTGGQRIDRLSNFISDDEVARLGVPNYDAEAAEHA